MLFDFSAAKAQARQAVHDYLAVPALYSDKTLDTPVDVNVRWHSKIDRFGDLDGGKWAEIIDGVNRVIFNRPELTEKGLDVRKGGTVTLTVGDITANLVLDTLEPNNGPIEVIWLVTRK